MTANLLTLNSRKLKNMSSCKFQMEGGIIYKPLLVLENYRVTALSCGIKISAMHCLVLSQSTRVTDRRTDGQNYDS